MGLKEGKRWKLKTLAVNCMDSLPFLRPIVTKVIDPLYPLPEYDDLLAKALKTFNAEADVNVGGYRKLLADIKYWCLWHGFPPEEYFLFHFSELANKERKEYISNGYKEHMCARIGNWRNGKFLFDKYATYERFKEYYKREVIKISNRDDFETFDAFFRKHNVFMKKAINLSRGRGIEKISEEYSPETSRSLFDEIVSSGECVCEEIVYACKEVAQFADGCLSTMRFATFRTNQGIEFFYPYLRIGRNGACVDNAPAGGLLAAVDAKTGMIISDAFDESGNTYKTHPDTGVVFKGVQLPRWNEVLELIPELFEKVPDMLYVGWDLAITDNGWVMMEGNAGGQLISQQITAQRPLMEELQEILDRLQTVDGGAL